MTQAAGIIVSLAETLVTAKPSQQNETIPEFRLMQRDVGLWGD